MKKYLKDKAYTVSKITIRKLRTHIKEGALNSFKDKTYIIKINKNNCDTSTAFNCTKKGKKELLKFIEREGL